MSFLKKEGGAGGSQTGVGNTPNTKKKKKKVLARELSVILAT